MSTTVDVVYGFEEHVPHPLTTVHKMHSMYLFVPSHFDVYDIAII